MPYRTPALPRNTNSVVYKDLATIDPQTDLIWGQRYNPADVAPSSYFDYFFSGQDMKVYIDGTEGNPVFNQMPIESFGYSIRQQKVPVFGYWSYTYDCVLRGNRIIEGQFVLITSYPDYMTKVLEMAANTRSRQGNILQNLSVGPLTEDDTNINQFWTSNQDPVTQATGNNLFSSHPPFDFVIVYGLQSVSVSPNMTGAQQSIYNAYQTTGGNDLFTDINERLVESDPIDQSNRVVLVSCELTGMQTAFSSDGSPIGEQYSFFARDYVYPDRLSQNNGSSISNRIISF